MTSGPRLRSENHGGQRHTIARQMIDPVHFALNERLTLAKAVTNAQDEAPPPALKFVDNALEGIKQMDLPRGNAISPHGFMQDRVVITGKDVLVHTAYATRLSWNAIPLKTLVPMFRKTCSEQVIKLVAERRVSTPAAETLTSTASAAGACVGCKERSLRVTRLCTHQIG